MKIKDVTSFIEELAPLSLQESYDNSGLQIGDEEQEVTGVMICLDCTEAIVEEASSKGCNLILCHHPLLFAGLKKITGKTYAGRVVMKAIQKNIVIYAAHTNLDNMRDGVSSTIADKIGLKNCKVLSPAKALLKKLVTFCPVEKVDEVRNAIFQAGAGVIGNYDQCSFNISGTGTFRAGSGSNPFVGEIGKQHQEAEVRIETVFPSHLQDPIVKAMVKAHPYEEVAYDIYPLENKHPGIGSGLIGVMESGMDELSFLKHLKSEMHTNCIRYTRLTGKKVQKVAVCGGSGSFLLEEAISQGAQVFVTADFKYHQFFDANGSIVVADIGHHESEQYTRELLYGLLKKKFSTFAIRLSETEINPVNYL